MPYTLKKTKDGYKVFKKNTNKSFSKRSLSKKNAISQMKALYASELQQHESLQPTFLSFFQRSMYEKK